MSTDRIEVYVAANGSPVGDGSRGYPANDLAHGLELVRKRREPGQRAVIWMGGGEYAHTEPVRFTAADSFTSVVALDPSNPPVLRGSVRVTGWERVTVNGHAVWAAPAPAASGRRLYVDGQAAPRPRYPREGFLRIEDQPGLDPEGHFDNTLFDGSDAFIYAEGDIPPLTDPRSVEVVVPHYWVQERMPIESIDRENRQITSPLRSIFALRDDAANAFARYYLDNVADVFGEVAGEWYLDSTGALTGAGTPQMLLSTASGVDPNMLDVRFPVTESFVHLDGTRKKPVREVRFEHITFCEADFAEVPPAIPPFGVREDPQLPAGMQYASEVQAASEVPAVIRMTHARSCVLLGGVIERIGGYGVSMASGCRGNLLSGVRFSDLGAGAVRAGGSVDAMSLDFVRANEISDCVIERGGQVYPNTVAILIMHGSHNVIAHNEIHDFLYSGISVGWVWGYDHSPSEGNIIVGNHIHHLGQGVLNDMGGVYLLGISAGTVVRGNHIHDVQCANYGGWGIYLDQGASHVLVEGNVVHDTSSQGYHQHYGREVTIRHNVWAYGKQGQVAITRPEQQHLSFTFQRNIVVGAGAPAFVGYPDQRDIRNYRIDSDLNIFHNPDAAPGAARAANATRPRNADGTAGFEVSEPLDTLWHALGYDRHSLDADPQFINPDARDLRVHADSPAHTLGIQVPDISGTGPRSREERKHPLAAPTGSDPFLPTQS